MEGVERSQTMAGAAEIMKELGMATSNEQAKANALLLNTIAGVQGAALQAGYDLPGKRAMMGMFPGMNSDQVINAII